MMRLRRWAAAVLAAALALCAGCSSHREETGLSLYFPVSGEDSGPALATQPYQGEADPESLLQALLKGPEEEGLYSPFPAYTGVRSCTLEDGRLTVDLSEGYGGLTGVALTLADYCITLTVCQLPQVDSVEITVAGGSVDYRSHQVLQPQEAMLELEGEKDLTNPHPIE